MSKKEAFTLKNGQKFFIHPGGAPMVGKMNSSGRRFIIGAIKTSAIDVQRDCIEREVVTWVTRAERDCIEREVVTWVTRAERDCGIDAERVKALTCGCTFDGRSLD